MLFIGMFRIKEGESVTPHSYLARRTRGARPGHAPTEGRFEGINILGEYWVQSNDPRMVLIFEAESNGPILELVSEWEEYFDISIFPVVKAADLMQD